VSAGEENVQVEHLRIDVHNEPDRVVVALHGELDLASAPLLQSELESAQAGEAGLIVLDVQDLEFIDSTGLRVILSAHTHAHERGREFALARIQRQLQRLLAITGVGEHLRILDSPDALLV
jgi:anti-sigma B factor antagonist